MEARRFNPETDYQDLCRWWDAYKIPHTPKESLPKVGVIVPGICADFIYQTDSDIIFLEGLISNPKVNREDKEKAFDLAMERIVAECKGLGYKHIVTLTEFPRVVEIARRLGFKVNSACMTLLGRSI